MDISDQYLYTLDSFIRAEKNGILLKHTINYLNSEGNNPALVKRIINFNIVELHLVEKNLYELVRVYGPEKNMKIHEPHLIWEKRINTLIHLVKKNISFPPFIVTNYWGKSELSDGSHRHEAFLRSGINKYWTIEIVTNNN